MSNLTEDIAIAFPRFEKYDEIVRARHMHQRHHEAFSQRMLTGIALGEFTLAFSNFAHEWKWTQRQQVLTDQFGLD